MFNNNTLDELEVGSLLSVMRYGTTGKNERTNAQPIVVNHIKGLMAVAHNGNIVNSGDLRESLSLRVLSSRLATSDTGNHTIPRKERLRID